MTTSSKAAPAVTEWGPVAEHLINSKSVDEMLAEAEQLAPEVLMELIAAASFADAKAAAKAANARHRINQLIKLALARPDVINRQVMRTVGCEERELYKRPGHRQMVIDLP